MHHPLAINSLNNETSVPMTHTNEQFSALMNAAVDGILLINNRGAIEAVNSAVERLFGYHRDELLGKNISVLMPEPDKSAHDSYLSNYLNSGEAKIIGIGREVKARCKSGKIMPIYLSVGDYHDGTQAKFVGIIRDLSQQKSREAKLAEAEKEIHQLVSRLAQVSRVSVMGEMAANIAHEINQPLSAIAIYAQSARRLLDAENPNLQTLAKPLDKIAEQALRAGGIIKGIRNWVREQDTERQRCALDKLILAVIEIARLNNEQDEVDIQLELDPALPEVMVDPIQLQQVLFNLIRNALDASESCPRAECIVITAEATSAERVTVSVKDRGAGIDERARSRIFEPYVTTKAAGMGMGLSICKTIVEAHGGELSYRTRTGGGTCFYFTLPTAIDTSAGAL